MIEFLRLGLCIFGGMAFILIVLTIVVMRAPIGKEIPGIGFVRIKEEDDETC